MVDRAREVLNTLLGLDRDVYKSTERRSIDESICKYMLVCFCPFKLFENTRRSIGRCRYTSHEEYYKVEYCRQGSIGIEQHEWEFIRLLVEIVVYTERCLEKRNDEGKDIELADKIAEVEETFNKQYNTIEQLVKQEGVSEAYDAFMKCEKTRMNLEKLKEAHFARNGGSGMDKCMVCGSSVVLSDTKSKNASHINGRLHKGHLLVRRKLAELLKKVGVSSITEIFPNGFSFEHLKV
ncbi:subunit of U1 snRNP [Ordospora colligata]|uniref:Subunit of U1 snRNP n=1 Tax=Ordospora colligata OC4 TaxID=1354746 RepID=A0A0B2UL11_9MICR|nr:subunit of U1 snRNP [Ordospora colligata OC4]KHN69670.1 subunit of U1 snRNP [Ordospora colligata OC4]TBU15789.1 subunit of U1 snRNP [Ordospora colligata]TBU15917.1 subunit of U1 snRNP [Ordospora colligata]TBU18811.1 subunit of U1 snRNP [Ordospora colligata]